MGDVLSSDIQSEKICDILKETELKPRGHVCLALLSYPLLTHALSRLVRTTWYEAKTVCFFLVQTKGGRDKDHYVSESLRTTFVK